MRVYFDNVAGTPLLKEVIDEMMPFLEKDFGNPSSLYMEAERPKEALTNARIRLANLINADPENIYFTSSGSESNNLAIKGIAQANKKKGNHIIVSPIEHFSVLNPVKTLEKEGFEVTYLPVDKDGLIDPDGLRRAIKKNTILISVMYANNEIGTIEPVEEIARIAREEGVAYHTDAVAAVGVLPVDVKKTMLSALSLSGNSLMGPKGAAALYIAKGVRIKPQIEGGIQEEGRRAGTENVPAIAGLGKAAEIAIREMQKRKEYLLPLRKRLQEGVLQNIEHAFLTGHPQNRLPGHVSVCIRFIEGESMLIFLNMDGIAASSGSACTSKALKASHVLTAIGIPHEDSHGSLVFTLGVQNSQEEVDHVIKKLPPIVKRLRMMSPLYKKFKEGEG